MRTSPALGGATLTSSIMRGFPASHATAALHRISYNTAFEKSLSWPGISRDNNSFDTFNPFGATEEAALI